MSVSLTSTAGSLTKAAVCNAGFKETRKNRHSVVYRIRNRKRWAPTTEGPAVRSANIKKRKLTQATSKAKKSGVAMGLQLLWVSMWLRKRFKWHRCF